MLDEKLMDYAEEGVYPFHMPGHKRRLQGINPYSVDITEISGFDNLHHADGILADMQRRAAALYGAGQTYALVNGSTCGLLAAICAAAEKGDRVLVARNCHKAVYHAIFLRELIPIYLYPRITHYGIQGQIAPDDVRKALEENLNIRAIILTSPTYDGIVSDIRSIAKLAHQNRIPLIVDQAHGAHFGLSDFFPENAVALGADAVVASIHKTLPAFTQTALLHLCGLRISQQKVEEYLDIFESSSPSYLLMGGIERCIRMMDREGEELLAGLRKRLDDFYDRVRNLKHLHVLQPSEVTPQDAYAFDDSRILIFTGTSGMSGGQLHETLRTQFRLEAEMACSSYVLALSSVMDTDEGFMRLAKALQMIDAQCSADGQCGHLPFSEGADIYRPPKRVMEIHKAKEAETENICLWDAQGRVSAGYIVPYPPGIPLAVPGERLDKTMIEVVRTYTAMGIEVEGLQPHDRINVVNSKKL